MKFRLIAASAALLASGTLHAQSSVTLYGIADVGIEALNRASKGHAPGADGRTVRMSSGNLSGSRWGLRGVEDLGQGLKAVFTLESGFHLDTGSTGDSSRLFDRQALVGLQGGFGSLTLGRQQTPVYDFGITYDPMALSARYSMLSQDRGMAGRANNAIKYTGSFGGLTASALYSFGYGNEGERPGDSRLGREYAFGLGYADGPFSVGAVYDQRVPSTDKSLGRDVKVQRAALAGSYAIGPAKAFAGYRWAMLQAGTPHSRSNLWWAGLGLQATPALSLKGAAYYQDFRDTRADPWLFVASADYALSKRTDAYVNVALAWNRADAGQGVASNLGVNGGDSLYGAPAPFIDGTAKRNQVGAVVGIRHKF